MIKKVFVLVLMGVSFVILSILINSVRTERIAVLVYGSSKVHVDLYKEAYYIYRKDHPHSRFDIVEIHVDEDSDVSKILERIRKDRIKFVILPHASSFVDSFAKEAEKYDLTLVSPFSMLSNPHENVVRTIPNFEDMARALAKYLKESGYDSVGIFTPSSDPLRRVTDRARDILEEVLSDENLKYVELDGLSFDEGIPTIVIVIFPSSISREMKQLSGKKGEIVLFTSNAWNFLSFYGYRLKGFKYISERFYREDGKFVERYKGMFGKIPSWSIASAYDAFSLIEYALMMKIESVEDLRRLKYFNGVQGKIPLSVDPDMSELLLVDEF